MFMKYSNGIIKIQISSPVFVYVNIWLVLTTKLHAPCRKLFFIQISSKNKKSTNKISVGNFTRTFGYKKKKFTSTLIELICYQTSIQTIILHF